MYITLTYLLRHHENINVLHRLTFLYIFFDTTYCIRLIQCIDYTFVHDFLMWIWTWWICTYMHMFMIDWSIYMYIRATKRTRCTRMAICCTQPYHRELRQGRDIHKLHGNFLNYASSPPADGEYLSSLKVRTKKTIVMPLAAGHYARHY